MYFVLGLNTKANAQFDRSFLCLRKDQKKEQINFVADDVDFDLQQLESNLNLIFNLQSHKLNEIMKMLTILSAIFIPLTFLAGIYGMNFMNIPETQTQYGYFYLLGAMLFIAALTVYYFKKKKWF